MDKEEEISFQPQAGPQQSFLETEADIAIFGGAAGGGKTFGLLLDPLRHHENANFGGTIFRQTSVQVRNEGGLWDESMQIYPFLEARPREALLEWRFPSGMSLNFAHLEYEKDVLNYQGSQIPWIGFDELTHFSLYQFFYMLSRNRSARAKVKPRVRATCNPDPDSWVAEFISWWIGDDGYPIVERAGVLRWFIRRDDTFIWAGTKDAIHQIYGYGDEIKPKSVTFIPSKLEDNKILMKEDPGYLANLLAQDRVTRARLHRGNWKVRAIKGSLFQREWFPIVDAIPHGWIQVVRFWDRAATKPNEVNKDPDWTRGLLLYRYANGSFVVADLKSLRDTPGQVEILIKATASHDGHGTRIISQQDPGSAGVAEAHNFVTMLSSYVVETKVYNRDKFTRAKPVSAQAEVGNIKVLRAPWNKEFFDELENFAEDDTQYAHDDIVDVLSGAFIELSGGLSICDAL